MTGATSKCICGVQPPENDLTTIFVCYFLHVRSSVNPDDQSAHPPQVQYSLNILIGIKQGRVSEDVVQLRLVI